MNKVKKIKHIWNSFRFYFSFLLLAFYLTISFIFLFTSVWKDMIPTGRGATGLFFLLFALLRFYVAFRRYKNKQLLLMSFNEKQNESPVQEK